MSSGQRQHNMHGMPPGMMHSRGMNHLGGQINQVGYSRLEENRNSFALDPIFPKHFAKKFASVLGLNRPSNYCTVVSNIIGALRDLIEEIFLEKRSGLS